MPPRIHGERLKLGIEISQATVSKYIEFFTVPTVTFRVLFVFLILSNNRRQIIHFNVTTNPSATWAGQRMVEGMGIEEVPISAHSPWQNPSVERVIGSIRKECMDHVIILG